MYGIYLRLDITVHDGWRSAIRAASRELTRQAQRDPNRGSAAHQYERLETLAALILAAV